MKRTRSIIPLDALIIFMALIGVASLGRVLTKEESDFRAIDLHAYWYSGHFIWQHADPYAAALQEREPDLPVYYLDGPVVTQGPIIRHGLATLPTNTAPVVLVLSLLSRFSLKTAAKIWTVINLGLILVIAWAVVHLFSHSVLSRRGLLLLFTLCSLIATREVLETGQTVILTLACMLTALVLGPKRQSIAGILLGIALSRYSLTFPGALYFLYKRWYRGLGISVGVQGLGVLAIAAIGKTTPQNVISEYIQMLLKHMGAPGMHLSASLLRSLGPFANVAMGLFSVGLLLTLAYWYHARRPPSQADNQTAAITLLVVIMQWNLLTFFHRRYDRVAEILFLAIIILWISPDESKFILSTRQRVGLQAFAALAAGVWILPLYQLLSPTLYIALFNLCSITALGISVWLLFRIRSMEPIGRQEQLAQCNTIPSLDNT